MANQIKYQIGFEVQQSSLKQLKASLQELQNMKFSELMKIEDTDLNKATKALLDIQKEANKVEDAISKAFNAKLKTINVETFNQELSRTNTSLKNVYETFSKAGAKGEAAFRQLSVSLLSTNVQLKESHQTLEKIGKTLSNTIKWNLASSAVNTLSNSIERAWGYVKSLDSSLNDIRIVTGKSADEMANFAVQANNAAKQLGKTTTDYTKAALIYAQQGLSDEEIQKRAEITLKAANVTGQSTDEVSSQLTAVWNGYKVTAQEAEIYVDRLAAVASKTASNLKELSTGMSKVASAAATMGVSEEQLAAQLSTIISATRQAPESVGTALRTIFARISDIKAGLDEETTLGNYSGKMAELGISVLDVNGELRNMGEVMEEIGNKWNDLSRSQQIYLAQTMAGQRQYNNLLALFDNFEEYNKTLDIALNAEGTLQKQQDIYLDAISTHLQKLKASFEDVYDSFAENNSINKIIDGLATVVDLFAKFIDSLGGGVNILKSVGSIGFMVFSQQIAGSIQTTINNFQKANEQVNYFREAIELAKKEEQEGLGNEYTQFITGKEKFLLQNSKRFSTEDFNSFQKQLADLSKTQSSIEILDEKIKTLYQDFEILNNNGNFTKIHGSFEDLLKSADGVEVVKNNLQQLKDSFDPIVEKQEKVTQSFNKFYVNVKGKSKDAQESFLDLKDGLIDIIKTFNDTKVNEGFSLFSYLPEEARKTIEKANNQLNKLEFDPKHATAITNRVSTLFRDITHTITGEIHNIKDLIQSADEGEIEKLEEKLKELQELQEQLKQNFESLESKTTQSLKVQDLVNLAGGIMGVTSAIGQFKTIWSQDLSIGQIITNSITTLPILVAGISKVSSALGLLKIETFANSKAALAAVTANSAATTSFLGLKAAATESGLAIQFLNTVLTVQPLFAVVAAITAVTTAINIFTAARDKANRKREEEIKKSIEEEEKIQNEVKTQKELLKSIEDLNQQYKNNSITRNELDSKIDSLINQYGKEGIAVRKLIKEYQNLDEAVAGGNLRAAKEEKESVEREKEAVDKQFVKTARGNTKDNSFIENGVFNVELTNGIDEEVSGLIGQIIKEAGAEVLYNSNGATLTFKSETDANSILELYNEIYATVEKIDKAVREGEISESTVENSGYYKGMKEFLERVKDSVEKEEVVINKLEDAKINVLGREALADKKANLSDVEDFNDYLEQRELLIQYFEDKNFTGHSFEDVDRFLSNNFSTLYSQYSDATSYLNELREKFDFEEPTKELASTIGLFSKEQISFLREFGTENFSGWKDLVKLLDYIAEEDFSNLDILQNLNEQFEAASSQYSIYSSLIDQISSSKKQTISKTEYEELAPEVQKYFSLIANGSYKMTGDAEEFYATVNNLSLEGFKDNITKLENSVERLNKISNFSYNQLTAPIGTSPMPNEVLGQLQLDYLAETGYSSKRISMWQSLIDTNLATPKTYENIANAVKEAGNQFEDFSNFLESANQAIYNNELAIALSAKSLEELKTMLDDSTIHEKAFTQAAIELDKVLDIENLDEEELKDYSKYLQEVADKTEELSNSLKENDESAQIVAKGIMKMNDAINELSSNWENWSDILQHSSNISEEYANALDDTKDALADLLDISKDYISEDFIIKHFEEITQAAEGSELAIDNLKQDLSQEVIAKIIVDNKIEEDTKTQLLEDFIDLQNSIPDLEIGAELNDEVFLAKAQRLIEECAMTVDQANALFDSLGFEANFATEPQTVTQRVPNTVTVTEEIGRTSSTVVDSFKNKYKTSYPILKSYSYKDGYTETEGTIDVPALATNGKTPKINKIVKKATGISSNFSSKNTGGSGSSSSSSKEVSPDTSQKDTKDYLKDDRDIYHDINIQIQQVSRSLERVQKVQERLFGKQLLDNLNKQTLILEQHKQKLREKAAIQQQDLRTQQQILKNLGVMFDGYGNIANYMSILEAKQAQVNAVTREYNNLIEAYNASTDQETKKQIADQAEAVSKQLKRTEDDYKELQDKIKYYDGLREDMEDLADQIEEETQKQIEINITKFRMELEIRLEMGEAERDWNKFKRKVLNKTDILKDTNFDKIFKDLGYHIDDFYSYFNVKGSKGSIEALTQQLINTRAEIEAIDKLGASAIYGDNKAKAMEDLKTDLSNLMEQMEEVESLINDIDQAYLDTIDDVADQLNKQIEDYKFIGSLLEHDMNLLTLLYGDKNYDAMNKYYSSLVENNNKQLDFLKKQAEYWKAQWDIAIAAGDTNAIEKFESNYKSTIGNLNSLIEESVKNLQDKYINSINKIFETLDRKISSGKGTDYLSTEWELMNKNANEYLDTINSAFAIQETERKYQKALNETKSLKNQQALKKLMDEQLENLKTKEKLTQYDVERAQKLLSIEQARIALEDAQSAKTSMRLKRDSQGNYSYEYVADDDGVAAAQDALAAAKNDLYNFDKNRYQSNLNEMLAAWKEFQSSYKEIVTDISLSEEDRIRKLSLLRQEYGEYINDKTSENLVIRNNLMESAFEDLASLYQTDVSNYNQMSIDEQNILMGDLVPAWTSGIQEMSDKVTGEGGFIPTCKEAFEEISEATKEYQAELDTMASIAGVDFSQVRDGIDQLAWSMKDLISDNNELIDRMEDEISTVRDLRLEVQKLVDDYKAVYDAAKLAVSGIHGFIQAQQSQAAAEAAAANGNSSNSSASSSSGSQTGTSNGSGNGNGSAGGVGGSPSSQTVEGIAGNIWVYGTWGNDPDRRNNMIAKFGKEQGEKIYQAVQAKFNSGYGYNGGLEHEWEYYKKFSLSSFRSGGYTGSWAGEDGKIGLLHQKEIVLNEEDTKNLLNTIHILRSVMSSLGGSMASRISDIKNGFSNAINTDSEIEQNVHIDATFPNVDSKREIEEAFTELVNLAAQRALKR